MKPDIIHYLDYRSYLNDLVTWLKKKSPELSMRKIAEIAGASSPNWVQQVVSRRIKAKPEALRRISQFSNLSHTDTERFVLLAAFDHAKNLNEKDLLLRKILRDRRRAKYYTLENHQYQFFSSWFIPVVRELCTHPQFDGTEEWIASKIQPPVRKNSVKKALQILSDLNLIRKEKNSKRWEKTTNSVTTPSEIASVAIKRYHKKVMKLGEEALETIPRDQRDFRSITLGLSEKRYKEIKKRIEEFWYELLEYAANDNNTERVFQYNTQLFPISTLTKENSSDYN
ncbi:TIGR02147 family protein [Chitinispirillales bacterium ANBcel5]|uniref:TIGR02147 family protein n=1 Tax=Cellulosispirillum alkaliphilum TaxID=3039283 RepID=UPI002A56FF34|nr:TIGR02147 family protein [Chitinispirillales bacterium ANBcel5]